jgi:serine/threonine protein kinase
MDRDTFFQHLRRSGLLSEETLEEAARLAGQGQPKGIARALVERGLLTRFQAGRVLAGKSGRLQLGQYRLLGRLGRGAMGRVFKAVHATMGRVVAIKVILPGILKDNSAVDLFNREVRAAARLSHPNIVTAYDANTVKGVRFLVMEYVAGPSLHALIKGQGRLPIDLACELMSQAAVALQYAHEQGMVHRDIKPANLLIANLAGPQQPEAGRTRPLLKVVDFGLARICSAGLTGAADTIRAEPGAVFGTVDYISPEQAHDIHAVDIRSDLYSLGCAFYHALAGQVPFPGGNSLEKLLKQLMNEPQPLRELRPEAPPAVEAIVQRLMAKERSQRFQTPAELARELASLPGRRPAPFTTAADSPKGPPAADPEAISDTKTTCVLPTSAALALPIDVAFRHNFRLWTAIVALSLRRRGALRKMNKEAFSALQRDLLAACEAQAVAAEDQGRALFHKLEGLLRPWLNPEALAQADLEIHQQLARECHEAEDELDKWAGRPTGPDPNSAGNILSYWRTRRAQSHLEAHLRKHFGLEL